MLTKLSLTQLLRKCQFDTFGQAARRAAAGRDAECRGRLIRARRPDSDTPGALLQGGRRNIGMDKKYPSCCE